MSTKMLIDAAHPEETRVVVVRDGKVEEFDFEAAARRQLRGNIYLAKVTRVEPSLQAAFVDYGGNRHGFLAFSEIHPDYYQIPHADRQALIAEEATSSEREADEADDAEDDDVSHDGNGVDDEDNDAEESPGRVEVVATGADDSVESVGGDDALEELPVRKPRLRRSYKIQEVIKKRQVLLVQVVKEERGTKGAALTTYLSLAGRYSVLMPNTARGGGISRKITGATDRKRLKTIAHSLEVPEGMGVILRTAGASRTKAEIKRDFEYLLRLWENVRELTLQSVAPALVYEEGSLVKRAIRDLYTKDISQVLVNGDAAYREAKDFMRMLMPSHAKNIQPYRSDEPIFFKHNVEGQLDAMFSPQVTLKAGGYIVLNQTEALVAIDVNSGRSTREHNIEDTALKTNLEAADEVARQLRLRDLAGLIVIDFIDMEEKRNNRAVERRLKEALKHDRARIQVGRISHFGLLEMSRQRIRFGVLESSLQTCPHCEGTGHIRSVESIALHVLRSVEYELRRGTPADLVVRVRTPVALYILNQKRNYLNELEALGISIRIEADETINGAAFKLEKGEPARLVDQTVVQPASVDPDTLDDDADEAGESDVAPQMAESNDDVQASQKGRRRRRRRGSGSQEARTDDARHADASVSSEASGDDEDSETTQGQQSSGEQDQSEGGAGSRRRRRGRRGGRRHRRDQPQRGEEAASDEYQTEEVAVGDTEHVSADSSADSSPEETVPEAPEIETVASVVTETGEEPAEAAPAPKKRRTRKKAEEAPGDDKPKRRTTRRKKTADVDGEAVAKDSPGDKGAPSESATAQDGPSETGNEDSAPADSARPEMEKPEAESSEPLKRGWWQRRKLFG